MLVIQLITAVVGSVMVGMACYGTRHQRQNDNALAIASVGVEFIAFFAMMFIIGLSRAE